jgi:hypothetical protein
MHKILKTTGILFVLITISSCAVKIPLSSDYFSNQKKVGIFIVVDSIGVFQEGAQGLLDMALTPGNRFSEPLQIVDKTVNPAAKITSLYIELFKSKGKATKVLEDMEYYEVSEFEKPKSSKLKFHNYDWRTLKSKGIDELLIVNVQYGLMVEYFGVIETNKKGSCKIDSQIINLIDNSIVFSDFSYADNRIDGKWKTPPEYENLSNAISGAIEKAIEIESEKFNK